MACEIYCNCEHCDNDLNCPLDHMGDGSPWCGKFLCTHQKCVRTECISYEEMLEEVRHY